MTTKLPLRYIDEFENVQRIKNSLKSQRYVDILKFLYKHFMEDNNVTMTIMHIQAALSIRSRSNAYDVLMGFCYLNMLEPNRVPGRRETLYLLKNKHFWKIAKEELNRIEVASKDGNE